MLPAPRDHASHAPRDPAPRAGTAGHDPGDLVGDSSLVARVALMGDEQAADRLHRRHEPEVRAYADHLGAREGAALLDHAWTRLRESLRLGSGLDVPVRVAWLSLLHQASSGSRVPRPWAGGNAAWTAFLSLPPAWQVVLWHVEVEQDPPEVLTTLTGADAASVERFSRVARGVLRRGVVRRHLPALRDASCLRLATELLGDLDATSSPVELQHLHDHGLGCSSCEHLSADVLRVEHDLGGLLAQRILGSDADWYLGRMEPDLAAALLATAATDSVTDPGPATDPVAATDPVPVADPVPAGDEEPALLVPVAAGGTPPAAARRAPRPSSGPAGRPAAGPASRPPSRPAPARRRSGSLVVGLATAAVVAGILGGLRGGAPLEADLEAGGRGARVAQDAAVRADAVGRGGGAGRAGAAPTDTAAATSGPAVVPASTGGSSGAAAVPASLGTSSGGPAGSPGAGPGPGPGGGPADGPPAPGDPGGPPDGPPDGPPAEQEPVSARVDPDSGSATVEVRPPLVGGGTSVTTPPLTGPRPAAR